MRVLASDGSSYEVYQNGKLKGVSTVTLSQKEGNGEYVVRDQGGGVLCRGRVHVRKYENVCIQCDVRSDSFTRVRC